MDFARIVECFDKHNVSFVSVTQAFNTTSSMGRLTAPGTDQSKCHAPIRHCNFIARDRAANMANSSLFGEETETPHRVRMPSCRPVLRHFWRAVIYVGVSRNWLEARAGIEPACKDLQSSASPLRHRASQVVWDWRD